MVALPAFTNKTWELLPGVSADLTRIRTRDLGKCVRFGQSGRKSLVFSNNSRRAHVSPGAGDEGSGFSKSGEKMERGKEEKGERRSGERQWKKGVF